MIRRHAPRVRTRRQAGGHKSGHTKFQRSPNCSEISSSKPTPSLPWAQRVAGSNPVAPTKSLSNPRNPDEHRDLARSSALLTSYPPQAATPGCSRRFLARHSTEVRMYEFDPRWPDDPRDDDRERDLSRGSRGSSDNRDSVRDLDPRDVFMRQVDLPHGLIRRLGSGAPQARRSTRSHPRIVERAR